MDQPQVNPNITPGPQPEKPPSNKVEGTPAQPEQAAGDVSPEVAPKAPERGREQLPNPEQARPGQSVTLPPVQPPPLLPDDQATTPAPAQPTVTIDTPLIADDVDVIEMEWVNKAKKIIKETKDNPHAQEEAVEQLQIDYLKKRYGKDIKKSRSG